MPRTADYRSTLTDDRSTRCPTLPRPARDLLDAFDFYQDEWTPSIAEIVDRNFTVVVISLSVHMKALVEAANVFGGVVFGRAFGRELPFRYADYFNDPGLGSLEAAIGKLGPRFGFLHAYDAILDGESAVFSRRAQKVVAPLPDQFFQSRQTWRGNEDFVLFHCGSILDQFYYFKQYTSLKKEFGSLPHRIFGPQRGGINDRHVLPWLAQDELNTWFSSARVFAYPSHEPRHLHFSPIEAMVIGTPVVYFKDSLLGQIAGEDEPGACADERDMHSKLKRLVEGDIDLARLIASRQQWVPDAFRQDAAVEDWGIALHAFGLTVKETHPDRFV